MNPFSRRLYELQDEGHEIIIVHGGGPAINKELAKNGVTSSVVNGKRVTSKEAVGIVQATLVGKVNPALVHQLNKAGLMQSVLAAMMENSFPARYSMKQYMALLGK